jgi:uncharacterized membrane protein YgcG
VKRFATVAATVLGAWLLLAAPAMATTPPVGPPYPDAVTGQRVYDYAGIFSPSTIAKAESIIAGIEARTGAQVAVYTQVKPQSDDLDKANADALALMNQWGVGRKGFDDGLVILFDMQTNLRHGQVSLYAGSGYAAAFLSDSERQAIFDNDMKPLLADGDLDGGLLAGLRDIDANATPEHAATLARGRQINALIAAGGVLLGVLLVLLAVVYWLRHGRDPVYIDDNSILMPSPPADLTPAMATLLLTERTSDRTVSAGLVDLAARGCIAFEAEGKHPDGTRTGVKYLAAGSGNTPALEAAVRDDIEVKGAKHDGYITPGRLYRLIPAFDTFKDGLETTSVQRGWLTAKPSQVLWKWGKVAGLEIAAAIVVGIVWFFAGASGLLVVATGVAVAGIVTALLARVMPSRTRQGAMLWAMLTAYQRTLKLTLAQAQSMTDVVKAKALPWITTPDQAMAWGVAFGLDDEIGAVLSRSIAAGVEQPGQGARPPLGWQPAWYLAGSSGSSAHGSSGHLASGSGSVFSASAIPDPGSIMAALGSIASPSLPVSSSSSSGSSFSSGSFGGGGGGGGGGAGGGF